MSARIWTSWPLLDIETNSLLSRRCERRALSFCSTSFIWLDNEALVEGFWVKPWHYLTHRSNRWSASCNSCNPGIGIRPCAWLASRMDSKTWESSQRQVCNASRSVSLERIAYEKESALLTLKRGPHLYQFYYRQSNGYGPFKKRYWWYVGCIPCPSEHIRSCIHIMTSTGRTWVFKMEE